jgi:phosphopantetheinyl transferase
MSISHSSRSVYAAVAVAPETSIGVDVTVKQLMPPGFSRFWLAPAEREWSHREGSQAVSLLWSLKESWYKAGGGEHPFTPKRLDVVTALSLNDLSLGELACNVPRPVPGDMLGGALLCHISSEEVASLVLLHDRTSLRPETFTFKEISP